MTDTLLYPRPTNQNLELHTVLHELQENPGFFRAFLDDREAALSKFRLDDQARTLLRNMDYRGMVARGVHPILVVSLQRQIEWGMTMRADSSGASGQ